MKKSIGNDSTKFVRDARNAIRACFAISGGGEVLFAAASVVIRITTFWFGQIRSHTFRNMMIPSPPPMAIETPQDVEKTPWPWPCMKCDEMMISPDSTVTSAEYRNHQSARGSNFCTTPLLVPGSDSFI